MPVYLILAYAPFTQTVALHVPFHGMWNLPVYPLLSTSLMGIAFSLIPAVMWPSVAYIVDQSRLGTAYALMTLIQQIGFFILNLLVGEANDIQQSRTHQPGRICLGDVDILGFGIRWLGFRHPAATAGDRAPRAWAGDHYYGFDCGVVC